MGTASDMNVEPVGALTIGFLAGVLSTVGYAYIKVRVEMLSERLTDFSTQKEK